MTLTNRSAAELASALQKGEISAVECATAFLDRIEATNSTVNAFLTVDRDGALATAEAVDASRASGKPLGPLAGLPVAVKDVLCTTDQPTTCASKMLKGYQPPYDADVVQRLRAAGTVILGKTNMDEFAMGGSNENSAYGLVRNPWDLERAPGGSSGGSAAAVAADMAPLAVGSDTGGSIRQPAGLCGITGLKPTYGRVSRRGLVAFSSSLDQIGPMARSAKECAMLLQAIAGTTRVIPHRSTFRYQIIRQTLKNHSKDSESVVSLHTSVKALTRKLPNMWSRHSLRMKQPEQRFMMLNCPMQPTVYQPII